MSGNVSSRADPELDCESLHALRRLHSAVDQLRDVEAMIELGADSGCVMDRVLAAQSALRAINRLLQRKRLLDDLEPWALPVSLELTAEARQVSVATAQ